MNVIFTSEKLEIVVQIPISFFKILFTYEVYPDIFKLVKSSEKAVSTPLKIFLINIPFLLIYIKMLT